MNRQLIIKAAKQAAKATVKANKQAVIKTAATAAATAAGAVIKRNSNNSSKKVNRTRAGQRPYFEPATVWEQMVTTPVAYSARWGSGTKPLRVSRSEMVAVIKKDGTWWPFGEAGFQVKSFAINPASSSSFPWLSHIGILFDKYKFHKLTYRFVNAASTNKPGTLMMGVDYDTLDAPPTNPTAFSQLAKYSAGPMFQPHSMSVPLNHPGNSAWLYTLDTSTGTKDPKTYNLGTFFLGLAATDADWHSGTVGYLFADYDVEFIDMNSVSTTVKPAGVTPETYVLAGKFMGTETNPTIIQETEGCPITINSDAKDITVSANTTIPAGTTMYFNWFFQFDGEMEGNFAVPITGVDTTVRTEVAATNDWAIYFTIVAEEDITSGTLIVASDISTDADRLQAMFDITLTPSNTI